MVCHFFLPCPLSQVAKSPRLTALVLFQNQDNWPADVAQILRVKARLRPPLLFFLTATRAVRVITSLPLLIPLQN